VDFVQLFSAIAGVVSFETTDQLSCPGIPLIQTEMVNNGIICAPVISGELRASQILKLQRTIRGGVKSQWVGVAQPLFEEHISAEDSLDRSQEFLIPGRNSNRYIEVMNEQIEPCS
jgi:hypothetical protein